MTPGERRLFVGAMLILLALSLADRIDRCSVSGDRLPQQNQSYDL